MTSITRRSRRICRCRIPVLAVLALLILVVWPARTSQASVQKLVIAGSGTNLPIVRILAKAFQRSHPETTIEVPASIGSTSGIRAVADNAIDIGLISRQLKESEKGLGLVCVTYARTPLVIGVHPSVAEDNISYAEILEIYRGKMRTWRNGREIIVLTREPGDSTIEVMSKSVPGFKQVYAESLQAKRWTVLLTDLKMNEALARAQNSIGYSDLGALTIERHRIKPLKVNGVAPTIRNVQEGKYTLVKPLMFVFQPERLPSAARDFLAFVRSKDGAKILRDNGYLVEE